MILEGDHNPWWDKFSEWMRGIINEMGHEIKR
jgi:hypothetical protein